MTSIGFATSDGLGKGTITIVDPMTIRVEGRLDTRDVTAPFVAPAAIDRRRAYSGSALPWPNAEFAMGNTQNKGTLKIANGGRFAVDLMRPNAYYVNGGRTLVDPSLTIRLSEGQVEIPLPVTVPYRTLTSSSYVRSTGRNPVH